MGQRRQKKILSVSLCEVFFFPSLPLTTQTIAPNVTGGPHLHGVGRREGSWSAGGMTASALDVIGCWGGAMWVAENFPPERRAVCLPVTHTWMRLFKYTIPFPPPFSLSWPSKTVEPNRPASGEPATISEAAVSRTKIGFLGFPRRTLNFNNRTASGSLPHALGSSMLAVVLRRGLLTGQSPGHLRSSSTVSTAA